MSPDFEYFLWLSFEGAFLGHTWMGIFLVNLPLSIIFGLIFDYLIKDILIQNLPNSLSSKLTSWHGKRLNLSNFRILSIFCLSVIIGALSHILWDAFTHYDGFFVTLWPVLSSSVDIGINLKVYKILQHSSSLFGLLAVFYYIFRLPQNPSPTIPKIALKEKIKFWLVFTVLSFVMLCVINIEKYAGSGIEEFVASQLVYGISSAFISLSGIAIFFKVRGRFFGKMA